MTHKQDWLTQEPHYSTSKQDSYVSSHSYPLCATPSSHLHLGLALQKLLLPQLLGVALRKSRARLRWVVAAAAAVAEEPQLRALMRQQQQRPGIVQW
jgi:hypothetical protein